MRLRAEPIIAVSDLPQPLPIDTRLVIDDFGGRRIARTEVRIAGRLVTLGAEWDILELGSACIGTDRLGFYLANHPTGDHALAGIAMPVMSRRHFLPRLDERVTWEVPYPYVRATARPAGPWRTLRLSFRFLEYGETTHLARLALLKAVKADPALRVMCYPSESGEGVLWRESWGWSRLRGWPLDD